MRQVFLEMRLLTALCLALKCSGQHCLPRNTEQEFGMITSAEKTVWLLAFFADLLDRYNVPEEDRGPLVQFVDSGDCDDRFASKLDHNASFQSAVEEAFARKFGPLQDIMRASQDSSAG